MKVAKHARRKFGWFRRATLPRAFEKRKKEKANSQQCREYLLIEGDYNF